MNIPDPVTTALATAGALQIAKQAQDFVAAASGHQGESIGTMLGNVANRRWKNAESVSSKSHMILLDLGRARREVPLNILQPALEEASVQEDSELQDAWANLLANAADPLQRITVEPAFVRTLSMLSPREVKFLDDLFEDGSNAILKLDLRGLELTYASAKLCRHPAPPAMQHFREQEILDERDKTEFSVMMDILESARILIQNPNQDVEAFHFTRFGIAFVRSCQKPKP
jgi:hypothetical protein